MSDALPDLPRTDPAVQTSWLSALLALVGGLLATALVGVAGYFWIIARMPAMMLLVMAVEAMLIGLALAGLYRLTKVRGVTVSVIIAVICGLLGGGYCHYSFYVRTALDFHDRKVATDRDAMRKVLPLLIQPGSSEYDKALADLERGRPKGESDPIVDFDRSLIYPSTRHHGFYGYMVALGVSGVTLLLLYLGLVMFLAVQLGWAEPRLKARGA